MKSFFLILALFLVYMFLGMYLEENKIILKPAYWSLYGYVFGIVAAIMIFKKD